MQPLWQKGDCQYLLCKGTLRLRRLSRERLFRDRQGLRVEDSIHKPA